MEILTREQAISRGAPSRAVSPIDCARAADEVTSPDVSVSGQYRSPVAAAGRWRGGGLGGGAPVMHAGWIPHQVVFAARGEPPFQLAYGNRQAKPARMPSRPDPGLSDDELRQMG